MSVQQVSSALERFISEQEAKAIVLKGDWGTGKTYLWDSVLKQKKEKISRRKYSYVSLFGLSNLSDLKRGIFENVVSSETADVSGDFRSLMENVAGVGQALDRAFRKGVKVTAEAASIPFVKGLGGVS
ncbi:P-loop NTPase fold protein [Pseudomonas aeruginosa]